MQYFGGKFRTWKKIVQYLESVRDGRPYLEPFVGGAWVLQGMSGNRTASDANKALITMYQHLQSGWLPPEYITREQYYQIKDRMDESDPVTAVAGFGYSFAAKWFGGYADIHDPKCHLGNPRETLLKKLQSFSGVQFLHGYYTEHTHQEMLIYCDPPYANTTSYGAVGKFDSEEFWNVIRQWSKDNTVVISEYDAPEDFRCVLEMPTKTEIRTKKNGREDRVERLFVYDG